MTSDAQLDPKPRRRWLQFSLRTLLVGMVVLCAVAGWVAIRMQQASRNRQRVAAIEDALAAIDGLDGYSGDKRETLRPRT